MQRQWVRRGSAIRTTKKGSAGTARAAAAMTWTLRRYLREQSLAWICGIGADGQERNLTVGGRADIRAIREVLRVA